MKQTLAAYGSFPRYRASVIATWPERECKRSALSSAMAALQAELALEHRTRLGGSAEYGSRPPDTAMTRR
jgi:hypothetical protein